MKRDLPAFWSVSTYGIPFNDERLAMGGAVNLYQVSWKGGEWVGEVGRLAQRYCTHLFGGKRLPEEGAALAATAAAALHNFLRLTRAARQAWLLQFLNSLSTRLTAIPHFY